MEFILCAGYDVLKILCESDTSECQLMNAKLAANTLGLSLFGFKTHIYDKIDISSVCICNICGDIQLPIFEQSMTVVTFPASVSISFFKIFQAYVSATFVEIFKPNLAYV